jgi:hypothetical protein
VVVDAVVDGAVVEPGCEPVYECDGGEGFEGFEEVRAGFEEFAAFGGVVG